MLVVVGILSLLMSIIVPAISKVRMHAKGITNKNNLRQISLAVNYYATDNNDNYPLTIATLGDVFPTWTAPTMLKNAEQKPGYYWSVSSYLYSYIENSDTMFCPSAPRKYKYIQEAWEAGEDWEYPDSVSAGADSFYGTYGLYWGYRGNLIDTGDVFRGPSRSSGLPGEGSILVGDCLGYGQGETVEYSGKYFSCEKLKGGEFTLEKWRFPSYWWRSGDKASVLDVKINAAYTDGHVSSYTFDESVRMRLANNYSGTQPKSNSYEFFLPKDGI